MRTKGRLFYQVLRRPSAFCCSGFLIQIGNIAAAFRKLFQSSTYWMLVLVFTLLAGNGLMIINNLSSIAKSIDPINGGTIVASLVALMSACNCLGRLFSGVVSDMLPWRCGLPVSTAYPCKFQLVSHWQ